MTTGLRVKDLTIVYGDLTAVDHLTLSVDSGQVLGLVGRNGAGKSSTISVLAGFLEPTAGSVSVSDLHFRDNGPEIRRRCGYLLSDVALFAYLTARETLDFLGEAYGVAEPARAERIAELLDFVGLADAEDRLVDEYSTGMQKRLAVAAALIHAPRVLVLDEPFESLDPLMVRRLKRMIRDFANGGGAVFLSSHLLDAVSEVATHIAVLDAGKLLAGGATVDVLQSVPGVMGQRPQLEDLYAAVVAESAAPPLEWLVTPT